MAYTFEVPEVGEGVVEVEITQWKVQVGEHVTRDQPLCEVTTDKASLDVSSPVEGVLVERFAEEGDIIAVHTPLARFDADGLNEPSPEPSVAEERAPAPPSSDSSGVPRSVQPAPPPVAPRPSGGPAKAAPAVRRRARELSIDLTEVEGTGKGGRVTHGDLAAHGSAPTGAQVPAEGRSAPAPRVSRPSPEDEVVPIRGVRRKIFERMQEAKRTAPHFTYVEEVDATRLVALRAELKPLAEARGIKLTYLPFFAKACSLAFREFPEINAVVDEEARTVTRRGAHHMGFACDTPNGLVVPVVRDVQAKTLLEVAAEMNDLFERARVGRCTPQELTGSSFTITGVGSIGGVLATPILNRPEVAILGTNTIRRRPVVLDDSDEIVIRHMTYLSNSFDHRIIDGAVGARFTARIKALLEKPASWLLELS